MKANDWYRIDKADGSVTPSSSVNVVRAARGHYDNVAEVIQAGRFQTPFAVYSHRQHLNSIEIATVVEGLHAVKYPNGCPNGCEACKVRIDAIDAFTGKAVRS